MLWLPCLLLVVIAAGPAAPTAVPCGASDHYGVFAEVTLRPASAR